MSVDGIQQPKPFQAEYASARSAFLVCSTSLLSRAMAVGFI
jgi:hypothetical protein